MAKTACPFDHCRSCGAEVYRGLKNNKSGKESPITVATFADGNVVIDHKAGIWRIIPKEERAGPLHKNHFADCPQRAYWQGRGRH